MRIHFALRVCACVLRSGGQPRPTASLTRILKMVTALCGSDMVWGDIEAHVAEVTGKLCVPQWVGALASRHVAELVEALLQRAREVAGEAFAASSEGEALL